MDSHRRSLRELADASGLPPRTIRFYIERGLVPRPHGEKRGAWYDAAHLEALLRIQRWTEAGLSLERIGELLSDPAGTERAALPAPRPGDVAVRTHVALGTGIELSIDPERAGIDPPTLRALVRALTEAAERVLQR